MVYPPVLSAIIVFALLVAAVLGLSFYLGSKAKSAKGYYAAHGQIPWFINGVAFAGDYLSAASFLGICGYIAFYGYDGFLYSIGFLAGWVVALFVIAEPIKRLGKFTFADALDSQFNSTGIKLAAAISTLIISIFYLIPQMVGAGTLIKPLLGFSFNTGVIGVGAIVILIVTTAGMVSTTWVQFIKGSLLVLFCLGITIALLARGLSAKPADAFPRILDGMAFSAQLKPTDTLLPEEGAWKDKHYLRVRHEDGLVTTWKYTGMVRFQRYNPASVFTECQVLTVLPGGERLVNGKPQTAENDLHPAGFIQKLPINPWNPTEVRPATGPLGPLSFLATIQESTLGLPKSEAIKEGTGPNVTTHTLYYSEATSGESVMAPGLHPTLFKGMQTSTTGRLNFISLMVALFGGTAALPHILIRYYTVKDQASARKSTVVGIAAIGLFYILTLYLGLGAMTSSQLDPTDPNMSAPLLAKAFGSLTFAFISAIAFTTVLGTVSGLIIAASGAVAHDLLSNVFKMNLDDHAKVRAGKLASLMVGTLAILLGIAFRQMNPAFLVGWAFNVAASANLPAITMLLFWKRTTRQGITASILVGLASSLTWIFLSTDAFVSVYHLPAASSPVPFNQPALVTVPLAYLTLVVVSLLTPRRAPTVVPIAS
jgi:cation/acetate symporter